MHDPSAQTHPPEASSEPDRTSRWNWLLWLAFVLLVVYPFKHRTGRLADGEVSSPQPDS